MLIPKAKLLLAAFACAIVFCGCASVENSARTRDIREGNWVVIAYVSGIDAKVQAKIKEVLAQKKIPCATEGDVIYTVLVPKSDATKATQLLHGNPDFQWTRIKSGELEILQLKGDQ